MSIESLQIQGIIPIPKEEKKSWNAKEKNCSKCDSKHICVKCVCQECGTVNLDTMICGCRPKEEWKEDTILNCLVWAGDESSAKKEVIEYIESLLAAERARIAERVKEFPSVTNEGEWFNGYKSACDDVLSLLQTP